MKKTNLLIAAAVLSPFCCLAQGAKPCTDCSLSTIQTLIVFLPVVIFLIILLALAVNLKRTNGKSSGLLAEKDPGPASDGSSNVNNPPQSASRVIAFLTALVALTIGVCICSFYMYSYWINPSNKLDLTTLTNVIWGLGIGVIPYGANKVSSALKPNN